MDRREFLHLLAAVPKEFHFGADRTTVAACATSAFQFKIDPLVVSGDGILIDKQWPALISNDHIEDAAVPEVNENN